MTSFYPIKTQSYDALRRSIPPTLEHLRTRYSGTRWEQFWLGVRGSPARGLCVSRLEKGIELTRYGSDAPNAVLQALANHWGCTILSEHGDERFEPRS